MGVMFTHDRIRELRRALGLNLREFAALVGVTEATASRWEAEDAEKRRHPTFQKMMKLNQIAERRGVRLSPDRRQLQTV